MSYERGFGVYPGDACFDPARPSWFAYWLDDSPESDANAAREQLGFGAQREHICNPALSRNELGGSAGKPLAAQHQPS